MSLLQDILDQKRVEVAQLRTADWLPAKGRPKPTMASRSKLQLIAEIKPASPSAGQLNTELSIAERARCYEDNGADMISVLCDEKFFKGSFQNLELARTMTSLPLLAKDFIIDESQLQAAAHHGASLALLIVRCLSQSQLEHLILTCRQLDLEPLVEVFTRDEATRALKAGAASIGVNARDLDTLEMDQVRAQDVISCLPDEVNRFYFSGVKSADDLGPLKAERVQGALIGEVLMRTGSPGPLLKKLSEGSRF